MNFHPAIQRGIRDMGFTEATPIQKNSIPPALEGRDVLGLAETNTGKTAAFALPLLDWILHERRRGIQALVLAPTRELATQIAAEIDMLARHTRVKQAVIYGGVPQSKQESLLSCSTGETLRVARVTDQRAEFLKLLERSQRRAKELSCDLNRTIVLHGDAADEDLLLEENIDQMDVFCALTNDDEANILSSMLVKRLGARKVMSLINRHAYVDLMESDGTIDVAISPQQITISGLLAHVRRGDVVAVHSLRRGAAEAIEAVAHGAQGFYLARGQRLGLEFKLVRQILMVQARGTHQGLQGLALGEAQHRLQQHADDAAAAGSAKDCDPVRAFDEGRGHAREHALAWGDGIGLAAHQAVDVGPARGGGEVDDVLAVERPPRELDEGRLFESPGELDRRLPAGGALDGDEVISIGTWRQASACSPVNALTTPPMIAGSTTLKTPSRSFRWNGSNSSSPSRRTSTSSCMPPRTLKRAEKSLAEVPGSTAMAR